MQNLVSLAGSSQAKENIEIIHILIKNIKDHL